MLLELKDFSASRGLDRSSTWCLPRFRFLCFNHLSTLAGGQLHCWLSYDMMSKHMFRSSFNITKVVSWCLSKTITYMEDLATRNQVCFLVKAPVLYFPLVHSSWNSVYHRVKLNTFNDGHHCLSGNMWKHPCRIFTVRAVPVILTLLDKLQLVWVFLQIGILLGCVLTPSRKTDNFKGFCFGLFCGPASITLG